MTNRSTKAHPAYRERVETALAAAAGKSPEAAMAAIRYVAGDGRLKVMRFTPRAVALRAAGFRPVGEPWRRYTCGPASMSWVMVQDYLHQPTGVRVRTGA